jgi:hypothetical protein
MTPQDRIRRYGQLATGGAVLVWALLCFLLILSPRLGRLDTLTRDGTEAGEKLAAMQKEIQDARIAGGPPTEGARFEKFGILTPKQEPEFYRDVIEFCTQTGNDLKVVRRAEVARPAPSAQAQGQQPGQAGAQGRSSQPGTGSGQAQAPQPVIERVPHTASFSGTFLNTYYLLRRLETYKRLLTIEKVELTRDLRKGYPSINGNITIELYEVTRPLPLLPAELGEGAAVRAQPASGGGTGA